MAGPVTVVPGDLLLASLALARGATGAVQPPPGWTEVPGAQAQTPADGVRTETFSTIVGDRAEPLSGRGQAVRVARQLLSPQ